MNTPEVVLRLVAGLGLILANGFFVAIEFALTRVRQYSESEFDTSGLRRAWEMTDDLEIYLTSCQVGITASSIAVGIVAEPALAALFEPYLQNTWLASVGAGGIIAFLIINLLHLTHGEQTPTYLGVERTKFVCRYGATPLYYFALLISPLIKLGDGVAKWTLRLFGIEMTGAWLEAEQDAIESRAELRNKLGNVLDEGELSEERQEEVMNALRVGETAIEELMVGRKDIVALSTTNSPEENLSIVEDHPHTRFPLVGESVDDFRGIVYMPAVLNRFEELSAGEVDMESLAVESMTIDANTSVSNAIDLFQEKSQELALVTRDGEVVGLLTATDAFESVMGELEDPLDRAARQQRRREDGPVTDAA
ncbi:IMP dehydrogenase [Halogranum amylolyticum]|uniref:IMP dehydrogenase n=1 Tax=Halogranum amylolyticum TaxID=660520 RepID=A0A1H8RTL0_9EURY|nr:hemolysin family protein [Halogranum amylolyticum]SEO69685.1 IMP dehydrogenase [Halogranum amylolyticum]